MGGGTGSREGGAQRHRVPFLVRITAHFLSHPVSNLIPASAGLIWVSKSINKTNGSGVCSVVRKRKPVLPSSGEVAEC